MLLAGLSGLESISRGKIIRHGPLLHRCPHPRFRKGFASFGAGTIKGDLITGASVAGYSIYAVLAKRVVNRYDTVTMNYINFLVAAVCLFAARRSTMDTSRLGQRRLGGWTASRTWQCSAWSSPT